MPSLGRPRSPSCGPAGRAVGPRDARVGASAQPALWGRTRAQGKYRHIDQTGQQRQQRTDGCTPRPSPWRVKAASHLVSGAPAPGSRASRDLLFRRGPPLRGRASLGALVSLRAAGARGPRAAPGARGRVQAGRARRARRARRRGTRGALLRHGSLQALQAPPSGSGVSRLSRLPRPEPRPGLSRLSAGGRTHANAAAAQTAHIDRRQEQRRGERTLYRVRGATEDVPPAPHQN